MKFFLILIISFTLNQNCTLGKKNIPPNFKVDRNIYVMHGFKLGQSLKSVFSELGKPDKTHKFPDGFVAFLYKKENYNLIFEVNNVRQDLIWAIQVSGNKIPDELNFVSLTLGESEEDCVKLLGKPELRKVSVDEITKKENPNLKFLSFYNNGNFSMEFENDKLNSIKITLKPRKESNEQEMPDFEKFILGAKYKDLYTLSDLSFFDPLAVISGKSIGTDRSLYNFYKKKEVDGLLTEIGELSKNELEDSQVRITEQVRGIVYKFKKGRNNYELFFVKSFDGWVLYELIKK